MCCFLKLNLGAGLSLKTSVWLKLLKMAARFTQCSKTEMLKNLGLLASPLADTIDVVS